MQGRYTLHPCAATAKIPLSTLSAMAG
jgi:hypothetical protein